MRVLGLGIVLLLTLSWPVSPTAAQEEANAITAATLAGTWSGVISHDGDTTSLALQLEPDPVGKLMVKMSAPVVHVVSQEIGRIEPKIEGSEVHLGPFSFTYDRAAGTLTASASVREGVAYVGSSDAAALFAFDAQSGRSLWKTDVHGWAWGQPAVSAERVYIGTVGTGNYLAPHRGLALAADRASGRPVWQFPVPAAAKGSYGFAGSPALGAGKVYFTGLDGHIYAFTP